MCAPGADYDGSLDAFSVGAYLRVGHFGRASRLRGPPIRFAGRLLRPRKCWWHGACRFGSATSDTVLLCGWLAPDPCVAGFRVEVSCFVAVRAALQA